MTKHYSYNQRDKSLSHRSSDLDRAKDLSEFTAKTVKQEQCSNFSEEEGFMAIEEYGDGQSLRAQASVGVALCLVACVATLIPAVLIQANLIQSIVPAIALFGVSGSVFVAGIVCLALIIQDKSREQRLKLSMFAPRASTDGVSFANQMLENDKESSEHSEPT